MNHHPREASAGRKPKPYENRAREVGTLMYNKEIKLHGAANCNPIVRRNAMRAPPQSQIDKLKRAYATNLTLHPGCG